MHTLTGLEAIAFAEAKHRTLNKYADPTENAREGLSVREARAIADEDPSLIWVDVTEDVQRVIDFLDLADEGGIIQADDVVASGLFPGRPELHHAERAISLLQRAGFPDTLIELAQD